MSIIREREMNVMMIMISTQYLFVLTEVVKKREKKIYIMMKENSFPLDSSRYIFVDSVEIMI